MLHQVCHTASNQLPRPRTFRDIGGDHRDLREDPQANPHELGVLALAYLGEMPPCMHMRRYEWNQLVIFFFFFDP